MPRLTMIMAGVAAGALLTVACGGSSEVAPTTAAPSATQTTASANSSSASVAGGSPTAAAATTSTLPAASAVAAGKVSANNATRAQLQATFEAAGIPAAAQWAKEVEEYRPYSASDPGFAKLRQELAKYNPAAGVVDKIIATLTLP